MSKLFRNIIDNYNIVFFIMTEKINNVSKKLMPDIATLIEKKLCFFQDVIQKTILHVQKNKIFEIFGVSDINSCINTLFELSKQLKELNSKQNDNPDNIINILQTINNELSGMFKLFGTESFEDFLWICFGNNSVNAYAISDMDKNKFELEFRDQQHVSYYASINHPFTWFFDPENRS